MLTHLVAVRQAHQQRCPKDADRIGYHHGHAPALRPPGANPPANDERQELHGTSRDLQILRAQRVESKGVDDDAREARQCRVGDLCAHGHHEQNPRLGILHTLHSLVLPEVVVLHALLVLGHPVDGDRLFAIVEELGRRRDVGQHKQRDESPEHTKPPKDEEHVHPPCQPGRDVAHRIPDQPAEHRRQPVGAVVDLQTQRLLGVRVPDGHDQDEGWVDCRFRHTQKETIRRDPCKGRACRCRHEYGAPDDCDVGDKFSNREDLESIGSWELGDEVAEVENGPEP